jgi:hypothetical protein
MALGATVGRTFFIDPDGVLVWQTSKAADEYSRPKKAPPDGGTPAGSTFFRNVADEAKKAGAHLRDGVTTWIVFIDANPLCADKESHSAGELCIAVLPALHLHGIVGEDFPVCPGSNPQGSNSCNHIGSVAHEGGHSFGLHHPTNCPRFPCDMGQCPINPDCDVIDLMYSARELDDPRVTLLDEDRATLNVSPLFEPVALSSLEPLHCAYGLDPLP